MHSPIFLAETWCEGPKPPHAHPLCQTQAGRALHLQHSSLSQLPSSHTEREIVLTPNLIYILPATQIMNFFNKISQTFAFSPSTFLNLSSNLAINTKYCYEQNKTGSNEQKTRRDYKHNLFNPTSTEVWVH